MQKIKQILFFLKKKFDYFLLIQIREINNKTREHEQLMNKLKLEYEQTNQEFVSILPQDIN